MTVFHPAIFFPQISKKFVIAQHAKAAEADAELGLTPNDAVSLEKEPISESSGSMELAQRPVSEGEEVVRERTDVDVNALGHVSR